MQRVPARIGDPLAAIETPALVVDLDPFERNLARMADATKGIRLRPHAKSHKCATIAHAQTRARRRRHLLPEDRRGDRVRRRAVCATCSSPTRSSAHGESRAARDARAARRRSACSSTRAAAVATLSDAASRAARHARRLYRSRRRRTPLRRRSRARGARARTRDQRRAGAALARPAGVPGRCATPARARRARRSDRVAAAEARRTRELIVGAGIACDIVTGAGTGTWQHERDSRRLRRVAAGLVRLHGRRLRPQRRGCCRPAFRAEPLRACERDEHADADRAIVDAGLKAFSFDSGLPLVHARVRRRIREGVRRARRAADRRRCASGDRRASASGSFPATATRPSISTTGSSRCETAWSRTSGRSRPAAR